MEGVGWRGRRGRREDEPTPSRGNEQDACLVEKPLSMVTGELWSLSLNLTS